MRNEQREPQTVALAQKLWDARESRTSIAALTKEFPELSVKNAYDVLWDGIRIREEQGETVIGYKMGLTSRAKREQMNLKEPIYGVLTNSMKWDSENPFQVDHGIHPKAEPEIAFHIWRPITSPPTPEDVFEVCDLIAPAIEILDSRYDGFKYFSLPDVIADNGSSSHFLIGDAIRRDLIPHWQELADISMKFYVDDKIASEAKAAEISGNPLLSVVALANLFLAEGRTVPANTWILAGAATPAAALTPGMNIRLETSLFKPLEFHTR